MKSVPRALLVGAVSVAMLALGVTTANASVAPSAAPAIGGHAHPAAIASARCSIPAHADQAVLKKLKAAGDAKHVSARVRLAMFETAWVESHANNLHCGDRDSVGVFQQRPSAGWGTVQQCENVTYAANSFLRRAIVSASRHPSWSAGQVAQSVQGSAFPSRYDQARATAEALIRQSGGSAPSTGYAWPVTAIGQHSVRVKALQDLLTARGVKVSADGVFGPKTQAAVKRFQSTHGLSVDGVAGSQTWQHVIVTLSDGSTGAAVKALQFELNASGARLKVDGAFGNATLSAVKSFQKSHRLSVDGVVGPKTWNALVHFH